MPTAPVSLRLRAGGGSGAAPRAGLLHRSDRGSRYAGDAYRELLHSHGAVAVHESCGMKPELIDGQVYATHTEAKSAIFSCIEV